MKLIPTGIKELDELLGGGLPARSNILVIGEPGCGKTIFSLQIVANGLQAGEPALFITTDNSPAEIRQQLESLGCNISLYESKNMVRFVDCYSWTLGMEQARTMSQTEYMVPGPADLNQLSVAISRARNDIWKPEVNMRTFFKSISTLLLHNNPKIVFRFLQVINARAKASDSISLLLVEEGMHEKSVMVTLQHLTDGTIEFKIENGQRYLRIPRMPFGKVIYNWTPFDITEQGVVIRKV